MYTPTSNNIKSPISTSTPSTILRHQAHPTTNNGKHTNNNTSPTKVSSMALSSTSTTNSNNTPQYKLSDARSLIDICQDILLSRSNVDEFTKSNLRNELDKFKKFGVDAFANGDTLNFLRRSLEASQRRVESLNVDLLRQVEGTDELINSLTIVKESNASLANEVKQLTMEIETLTCHRFDLEKEMKTRDSEYQNELSELRKVANINLSESEKKLCDEKALRSVLKREMANRLAQSIHSVNTNSTLIIRKNVADSTLLFVNAIKNLQSFLSNSLEDLLREFDSFIGKRKASFSRLKIDFENYKSKMKREVTNIEKDLLKANSEKSSLELEITQLGKSIANLDSQYKTKIGILNEEIDSLNVEMTNLSNSKNEVINEYDQYRQKAEGELNKRQNKIENLTNDLSVSKREIENLTDKHIEISSENRQLNDALNSAVSGNEHLRAQLSEQRIRFTNQNEQELTNCRNEYEERIDNMRNSYVNEQTSLQVNIANLEKEIQSRLDDIHELKVKIENISNAHNKAKSDLQVSNEQLINEQKKNVVLEDKISDLLKQAHEEQAKSDEKQTNLSRKIKNLSDDCEAIHRDYADFRQSSADTINSLKNDIARQKEKYVELEQKILSQQSMTSDVEESLQTVLSDKLQQEHLWSVKSAESCQKIAQYESTIQDLQREMDKLKVECEGKIAIEGEKFNQWRSENLLSIKSSCDDYENQLLRYKLKSENEIKKKTREIDDLNKICSSQLKTIDLIEQENTKLHQQISEMKGQVQWLSNEKKRDANELSIIKSKFEGSIGQIARELDFTKKTEEALSNKLAECQEEHQKERVKYAHELSNVKSENSYLRSDLSSQGFSIRQEYNQKLDELSENYKKNLKLEKGKIDSISHENDQLRKYIGEHKYAAQGMASLQKDLESHIQKLQRHTDDLKKDLN